MDNDKHQSVEVHDALDANTNNLYYLNLMI